MSETSATRATPPGDLFDRWLAHHESEDRGPRSNGAEGPVRAGQAETTGADEASEQSVPDEPSEADEQVEARIDEPAALLGVADEQADDAAAEEAPAAESPADERFDAAPLDVRPVEPDPPAGRHSARVPADAPSATDAGRAVLEAFSHERLEDTAPPESEPDPAPPAPRLDAAPPVPPAAAPAPARTPPPLRRPPVTLVAGRVLSTPSRGGRRALGVLMLVAAAGTGAAGWAAWVQRTTPVVAAAAGLAVLTVLLWAARRRTPVTSISVQNDVLRITQGTTRHEFPLAGPYPPIDVLGDPGDRGWKVLIQRRSMSPFVVTRQMVDPHEFTELIRRYRPQA